MTVETADSKIFATGNGVTTAFDFSFKYFHPTDITVALNGVPIATTLYTLTPNPSGDGGTVTFLTPPALAVVVLIYRILPYTQETKIPNADKIAKGTLEDAYDKLTLLSQQLKEITDRTVQLSIASQAGASLVLPDPVANKAILWNTTASGFINSTDDFNNIVTNATTQATAAAASAVAAAAQVAACAASAVLAQNWANQTGSSVSGGEFSAKEYAIGTTATTGSAKDWATKTSAIVAATDYSAKEFAQGTQAATGGSSKNWAQQTGADVTGATANGRSAKSWAQDALTGATLGGSSKDWAKTTGGTVDGTEYAAKEYAIGTTATTGSAKDWANKTSAIVAATDYSAKEFAQGTQAATGGSSKNWAQQTGADVTGATANSRSAKSWAQDALTGATLGGSSKDWAQSASLPDGTSKSAKSYAADAATSAAAAAASASAFTAAAVSDVLTATDNAKFVSSLALAALWEKGTDIVSANALAIPATGGGYFKVTGTTSITSITGDLHKGRFVRLEFGGILTLTHNATSLILPTGANITTAVGDIAEFVCLDASAHNWKCVGYTKADGTSLASTSSAISGYFASTQQTITLSGLLTLAHGLSAAPKMIQMWLVCTSADSGYSIGDVVYLNGYDTNAAGSGFATYVDATNIYVRFPPTNVDIANKSTSVVNAITTANWKFVARGIS